MAKLLIALLLAGCSLLAYAQTLTSATPGQAGLSAERLKRIDGMLQQQISEQMIPGAVVLIARNGKIVLHKAYGYSDAEKQIAMKRDDIFRMASQTKAITSLAVMMLWEEGKFRLDDPVSLILPEFKKPNVLKTWNPVDGTYTTEPARSEITIRQLLTHTSGIGYPEIGSEEFVALYAKARVHLGTGPSGDLLADKMKILAGLPLKHQPGEQFTYGLNIDVLGYLVEVVSGMPLDRFFETRIFGPLGMKDTYFYLPKAKHARLVPLYERKAGQLAKVSTTIYGPGEFDYPLKEGRYFSGGAGLSGPIEDYAKLLQFFLNKGEYNGVRLLSRKTVELMLTNQTQAPITEQVGLGFGLETAQNDHLSVVSAGAFMWGGAFSTQYWADPKEKLIGLIYTNMYATPDFGRQEKFKVLTYQAIVD